MGPNCHEGGEHVLSADETQAILEACPAGVLVLAPDGRVRWLNQSLAAFLGEPPERLIGKSPEELTAPHLRALLALPELVYIPGAGESPAPAGDRYLSCHSTRLGTATVGFFLDVTAEHALNEENATLARLVRDHVPRDPLTGLLNRHGLFQDLERHVARSRRYENPLAVLLLSPRNLGGVEASAGPEGAEGVLVGIAHMLRDQLRWADSIGRLEDTAEFTLVLPETDETAARGLADKLRRRLQTLRLADGRTLSVDVALGLAQWQRGDDASLLLRRARERLETDRRD